MRKHREDRDVQRAACLALRRLSPLSVKRWGPPGIRGVTLCEFMQSSLKVPLRNLQPVYAILFSQAFVIEIWSY